MPQEPKEHLEKCVHHGNPLLADGSVCDCPCHQEPKEIWEEKIKEEWEDRVYGSHYIDDIYPFPPTSKVANDIESWWLKKMRQAITKERRRIWKGVEETVKESKCSEHGSISRCDVLFIINPKE